MDSPKAQPPLPPPGAASGSLPAAPGNPDARQAASAAPSAALLDAPRRGGALRCLADADWWEDAACCCEERCGVAPEGRQADATEPDI